MNTEEVLIFLLALASGLSLFVGLAQALDGRPSRPPTRSAQAVLASRRRHAPESGPSEPRGHGGRIFSAPAPVRAGSIETLPEAPDAVAEPAPERPSPTAAPPARPWPRPRQIPLLDAPESRVETEEPLPAAAPSATPVAMHVEAPSPAAVSADEPAPGAETAPVGPGDLVAGTLRLLKGGSHEELLSLLEPVLKPRGRGRARPAASHERALLWAMAGLASRARGDDAGTRAAFERGIRDLPRAEMPPPDAPLVPVAEWVGGQLLGGADAAAEGGAASSLAGLRLCVGILRAVATAQPGEMGTGTAGDLDQAAAGAGADELPPWGKALRAHLAVEQARDALATAAERRLASFLGKRDHTGGYRWLKDALAWEELGERRATVEDAYWQSVGGEVVRLTSQALEDGADLPAAVASLRSAEAIVQALPEEVTRSPRIDEIRRRLWWGHTKLGVQRLEMSDVEGALGPLYEALRLASGDADRESETRHTLAQALETMAAGVSEAVEDRLGSGDRAAAEAAGQDLCGAIDRGLAEGVSQEELAGALATRQRVMSRIAQADGP